VARMTILVLPFRWIAAALGGARDDRGRAESTSGIATAARIGQMVARVSGRTPWRSNCLTQAVAAHAMLRWRGVRTTLYLGVTMDGGKQMRAHAWLRYGPHFVTGRRGHRRFSQIWPYSKKLPSLGSADWV
jgi:hypothetical protein